MANSSLKNTNPLVPIGIVGGVVAAVLIGVFAMADDGPPDEPTIIAEDVNGEPAGAGTTPEGQADTEEAGVTDQLDEVEPAAGGDIPAQENTDAEGSDTADSSDSSSNDSSSESAAAETGEAETNENQTANNTDAESRVVPEGEVSVDETGSGGANDEQEEPTASGSAGTSSNDGPASDPATESATDSYLLEPSTQDREGAASEGVSSAQNPEALPEGRDATTELTPDDCQEVVRDTDEGGAAVIPTPSGPEGNIGDCVQSAQ